MLDDSYPKVHPGPPRPSQILLPSQFSLPRGTERYVVEGAGAILLPVYAGDQITIINDEGGQVCEVIGADSKGRIDAALFGTTANASADGLRALLLSDDRR